MQVPQQSRQAIVVQAGQTLASILRAQGYGGAELVRLLDSGAESWRLERLRPGQSLEILGRIRSGDGLPFSVSDSSRPSVKISSA